MTSSLHDRLFERFYQKNEAQAASVASSHWKDYSGRFSVRKTSSGYDLQGFGFGGSGHRSVASVVMAAAANSLQSKLLRSVHARRASAAAKPVVARMGLSYSQDAFRQACTAEFLANRIPTSDVKRVLVIGDGHGVLSALLHQRFPSADIFLVDLGCVLFFQAYYLSRAYPDASTTLCGEDTYEPSKGFHFCPAEELDALPDVTFDLAVNIASMQEMDPSVIATYFALLRETKTALFYCCNRLEKQLIGGEMTRFFKYPWIASDRHLVDEPCPWHQWFIGRSASPHVQMVGMNLPLVHHYDGIHWHRLTRLSHD